MQINLLLLLIKKCALVKFRNFVQTSFEFILILTTSFLVGFWSYNKKVEEHEAINYKEYPLLIIPYYKSSYLLYSPNSSQVSSIMTCFKSLYKLKGFHTKDHLEKFYIGNEKSTFAAVQFDTSDFPKEDFTITIRLPSELRYPSPKDESQTTNWMTHLTYPAIQKAGPRSFKNMYGSYPNYYLEGFLTLQHLITASIINRNWINDSCDLNTIINSLNVTVSMKRFPHGKWVDDKYDQMYVTVFGMVLTIMFFVIYGNLIQTVLLEKEQQLKESMKIMGLSNEAYWISWFAFYFIYLMIYDTIFILILKLFGVFSSTNTTILFLFLLLYSTSLIGLGFAVTAIFSKATTGVTVGALIHLLFYFPFMVISQIEGTDKITIVKPLYKIISCIFSTTAMEFGNNLLFMHEMSSNGAQWSNISRPLSENDLRFASILLMLFLDTCLYLFLAFFLDTTISTEFGVPLPWYFLCTRDYWFGASQTTVAPLPEENQEPLRGEFYEKEPNDLNIGIKIVNLRKVFKTTNAVNNLNLNIFENQITVLLGHNGAGKTTTMLMLTGMIQSTSGTAIINGYDINKNRTDARKDMSICLQNNVVFDNLTVAEHIQFYCKLKGMNNIKGVKAEVNKYVTLLDLFNKKDSRSSKLSGGMKRKLSVAIALCANSKIVILDEPTSGMDPMSRRSLWNVLKEEKNGRTILLSTHYMDEAEFLGDRIAILAQGELQCCGTTFFLKKKYSTGYHLIIDKTSNCSPVNVTKLLRKFISNVSIHTDVGNELIYVLPEDKLNLFENMLQDLENNQSLLGIRSFGISLATLEEVFLKAGKQKDLTMDSNEDQVHSENSLSEESFTIDKSFTCFHQIHSVLMKRFLYIVRDWKVLFTNLLLGPFLIVLLMKFEKQHRNNELPPLALTLDPFPKSVTLVEGNSSFLISYIKLMPNPKIVDDLENVILKEPQKTVRQQNIIGVKFKSKETDGKEKIITYFNNDPYHSPAIALGYVLRAIAHSKTNKTLFYINEPLPYKSETKLTKVEPNLISISLYLVIGIIYTVSYFVMFYIKERMSGFKHLQYVAGANILLFWSISLIVDLIIFAIEVTILLALLKFYNIKIYNTFADTKHLVLILFCFAWCVFPFIYLSSYYKDQPADGFNAITMILIAGLILFIVSQYIKSLSKTFYTIWHIASSILPTYTLVIALNNRYVMHNYKMICDSQYSACIDVGQSPEQCKDLIGRIKNCQRDYYQFEYPGLGYPLLNFLIYGSLLFFLVILCETNMLSYPLTKLENLIFQRDLMVLNEDEDVEAEKQRILSTPTKQLFAENILVLKNLTKYYLKFPAVNSLYVGVKASECFGLLGVNGAGKTTSFKIMTGELRKSLGNVWINGLSVGRRKSVVGYCPQIGGSMEEFTAKETLIIFALMHGYTWESSKKLAVKMSKDFDFFEHLNKMVKHLSGGNRKKINAAVALLGDPPVVFLDEPTTGMDVATKRFLWDVLIKVRDQGKCIILTSHSMEECEALCTRIAIMVNGEFKCLGSVQHLKDKFAAGYFLTIKLRSPLEGYDKIAEYVLANIVNAKLSDKHEELLTYYIADKRMKLSKVFGVMEKAKKMDHLNVDDYSFGQGNLEQVFLTLSKFQHV